MTSSGVPAKVRPYDGEDAASIISSVQNRPRSRSNAGNQAAPAYGGSPADDSPLAVAAAALATSPPMRSGGVTGSPRSIGKSLMSGHRRSPSGSNASLPPKPLAAALFDAANGGPSPAHHLANAVAAEAAAAAAAAAASSGTSTPDVARSTLPASALKSLPMNPMASRGQGSSPPIMKKGSNGAAGLAEVV